MVDEMPRHRHDLQCISSRTEGGCFLSLESVSTYSNTIQKISVGRLSIPPFLFKSSAHPVPTSTKIDGNTAHTQKNLFFKLKKNILQLSFSQEAW
jgi:hypothetical protein